MSNIVIFGASDVARLAHLYFTRDSEHQVVAFTVDPDHRRGDVFEGLPVCDFTRVTELYPPEQFELFVAVGYTGMNQVRANRYLQTRALGYRLVSYVSSRCTFLTDHPVGDNCFILEDNTIQPGVRIGNNVTLWSGNHIGHDSIIEDHCFITSQVVVSGHVHVGSHSFLGVNASLRNGITVAPRTLVGAGATITSDTVEGSVYVPPRAVRLEKASDEIAL